MGLISVAYEGNNNTLQHTATHCNKLQHTTTRLRFVCMGFISQDTGLRDQFVVSVRV